MIKVSILIPMYNSELYIDRCILSIPNRKDIEVIVVDDNSKDNSLYVINKYKDIYNIRIYKNKDNIGVGLTRNRLLELSSGEYVFFLDSDDYLYTDSFNYVMDNVLDKQVILMGKHKRNDNHIFNSGVHRGDFIRKDFIGSTRFPNMRQQEDSMFRDFLKMKKGYKIDKVDNVIYHYNEPRVGSLTWNDRKRKNIKGYDKGVEEWELVYGKK